MTHYDYIKNTYPSMIKEYSNHIYKSDSNTKFFIFTYKDEEVVFSIDIKESKTKIILPIISKEQTFSFESKKPENMNIEIQIIWALERKATRYRKAFHRTSKAIQKTKEKEIHDRLVCMHEKIIQKTLNIIDAQDIFQKQINAIFPP